MTPLPVTTAMKHRLLLLLLALGILGAVAGCTTESDENGVKVERHYFGG